MYISKKVREFCYFWSWKTWKEQGISLARRSPNNPDMDPKPTNNFVCKFKLSVVHVSLSFNNNSGFKRLGVEWTDDRLGVGASSHR